MIDVKHWERVARDDMVAGGRCPRPAPEVAAALERLGVRFDLGETEAVLHLPPGWSTAIDPLNHRRWLVLDADGLERAACLWKSVPFGQGSGSMALVTPSGFLRRWEGHGSEFYAVHHALRCTIRCVRCTARTAVAVSERLAAESPSFVETILGRHERQLAGHACPGVPGPAVGDARWPFDGEVVLDPRAERGRS